MKEVVIMEAMSLAKPERKARKCLIPKLSINAHGVILSIVAVGVWIAAAVGSETAVAMAAIPALPSLRAILIDATKKGGEA